MSIEMLSVYVTRVDSDHEENQKPECANSDYIRDTSALAIFQTRSSSIQLVM